MPSPLIIGASGGLPVNSLQAFNYNEPMFDFDGQIWLRTGFVETDYLNYPDAFKQKGLGGYSGVNFVISGTSTDPRGMTSDDLYFWVVDVNNTVYQFNKSTGAYTGTNFDVSTQGGVKTNIAVDDTNIYIVSNNRTIYQFDKGTGVYTGFNIDVTAQDSTPQGVAVDDNFIWVVGATNDAIYKYNKSTGAFIAPSFSVSSETLTPSGIAVDDSYIWISGSDGGIFQYDKINGTYNNNNIPYTAGSGGNQGLSVEEDNIYALSGNTDTIYQYVPAVGVADEYFFNTETLSPLPYYVRIK